MNWEPLHAFVRDNVDFLLVTHVRTDGDGLGSELALADLIRHYAKPARIVNPSRVPARYTFLDPDHRVQPYRGETAPDLLRPDTAVLIVDTNTWSQLGTMAEVLKSHPGARLCIDHHVPGGTIDGTALVDETAEATAVLVFEAFGALGVPVTEDTARALFVAVTTDTGWFRFTNVRPRTHELAARLIRLGADPPDLYTRLYESNRPEALKLRGRALASLCVDHDGQVCYASLAHTDFTETGASYAETEELVNLTLTVRGVELGLLFVEQPDGTTKVSFRSRRRVDCNMLARRFGGGGHVRASGATLDGPLAQAQARVLDAVRQTVAGLGSERT